MKKNNQENENKGIEKKDDYLSMFKELNKELKESSKVPLEEIIFSNILLFTREKICKVTLKEQPDKIYKITEFNSDYFDFSCDTKSISFRKYLERGKNLGHNLLVLFNSCDPVTHRLDVLDFIFVTIKKNHLSDVIQGINKFDFVLSNVKPLNVKMTNTPFLDVLSQFGYIMDYNIRNDD